MRKTFRSFILTFVFMLSMISTSFAAMPEISSDSRYFDFSSGCFVLDGNVVVKTDDRVIEADKARVSLTTKEVWADGNIYLEEPGQQIKFTGGNLYAADETKTVSIKGNVKFERPDITIKAERCSFNWKTKIAEFDNLVEVTKDGKVDVYDVVHYNVIEDKIIDAQ